MRFRPGARLDPGQVSDRRGMGGGGGLAVGGGGLGLAGLVIYLLLQLLGGSSGGATYGSLDGITQAQQPPSQSLGTDCRTGADANERQDCRILGDVNSVQKYWSGWFKAHGKPYTQAKTVFFTGATSTERGNATTDVGPFYCPVDKLVYIDLGFYEELHDRFGAQGGPFAEAYVIARVRAPHPGPARRPQPRWLAGSREPLRPHRAAGRLLRRRLGAECGRARPRRGGHERGHRERARRRGPRRRRPDPAAGAGQHQPGLVHPRHRRPAADV